MGTFFLSLWIERKTRFPYEEVWKVGGFGLLVFGSIGVAGYAALEEYNRFGTFNLTVAGWAAMPALLAIFAWAIQVRYALREWRKRQATASTVDTLGAQ